jgi:ActR/RegA family two-component response regulator
MTEPLPVRIPAPEALPDPLPANAAARAPAGTGTTTFVALSEDATLREAIGGAIATRGQVVVTTTPHAFADQLVARPDGIAILDLAVIPGSGPLFIERLRAQFPALVLIVVGGGRDQAALAPLVAEGTVCRFAPRPVSAQRLGLFLDAALRRREALALESRAVLLTPPRSSPSGTTRIAIFILLLIVAAGTGVWLLRRPARLTPPPAIATEPQPAAPRPAGTAALTPAPADSAPTTVPAAPSPPVAATTAEARHEAQLARRLMEVGLLIDPTNNSARSHIDAATRLAPDDVEVRRTARALSGRLVNAARSALLAKDVAGAQRWVDAARAYGVNPATLAELDEQLGMLKGMMEQ